VLEKYATLPTQIFQSMLKMNKKAAKIQM
jgi:hypothetical protein